MLYSMLFHAMMLSLLLVAASVTASEAVGNNVTHVLFWTGTESSNTNNTKPVAIRVAKRRAEQTHYGDPFRGPCMSDEKNLSVTGVAGFLCSPPCDTSNHCPTDVPAGSKGRPTCALQDPTPSGGKKNYCVLECSPTAADAHCGSDASCKPIQGLGICTYNNGAPSPTPAPTPASLPDGCVENNAGGVTCAGNASPEPGCEQINQLCCISQLPLAFEKLLAFRAGQRTPFKSLSFTCSGNFGGGDVKWATLFGSLLQNVTALTHLVLDLSFNDKGGDAMVTAVLPGVLRNSPALANFSFIAQASAITDTGASQLGQLLQAHLGHSTLALSVDISRNDKDEVKDQKHPLTADGVGALAKSVGQIPALKQLTLLVGYDVQITSKGIGRIATGLQPLQNSLESLRLDFGFVAIQTPEKEKAAPLACMAKILGSFKSLHTLDLNLDSDVDDPDEVRAMGLHLACLPITKMQFPRFNSDADCHCGLLLDEKRSCLVPNKYYSDQLGHDCFQCQSQANATACED